MNQDREASDEQLAELCDRARRIAEKLYDVLGAECSEGPGTFNYSLAAMALIATQWSFNNDAEAVLGESRFTGLVHQTMHYGRHLAMAHDVEPKPRGLPSGGVPS